MGNAEGVACPAPGTTVLVGADDDKKRAVVVDSPEEVPEEEVANTTITVRMINATDESLGDPVEVPLGTVSPAEAPRKPYASFEEEQLAFLARQQLDTLLASDEYSEYVRTCAASQDELLGFVRQIFYNVAGQDWGAVQPDQVAEAVISALQWRDEHGAGDILAWQCPEEQLQALPGNVFKHDREGRPVVWTPVFAVVPSAEGITEELIQKVELQRQVRITEALKASGTSATTNVIDIQGLGMNALSFVSTIAKWGEVSEKYFPCRVSSSMIINAPWGFSTAFSTIKPLFGARTASLLSVHGAGEETLNALREKIPEECIPKCYGGTATVNGDDDVMCESILFPGGLSPAAAAVKQACLDGAEAKA